ncbi:MAG: hypothetical protein Q8J88_11330 [Bacteroidales bacterium]|nr:hypothetical protein [Bacteroidales bacterium]
MTLSEIQTAIKAGQVVYWSSLLYQVTRDTKGQYFIVCLQNNHAIGLTWADGKTLNGREPDFFIHNPKH